jgi:hypothetical protein
MGNTFRKSDNETIQEKPDNKKEGKGLFAMISQSFKMDGLFDEGVPVKFLPQILWVTVLIILYIANAHYTEKTIRKIDKLKYEVEDLRTDFTTLKASYMYESKQSEVARNVEPLGLVESKNPPIVIELEGR